ncbi:MAG: gamma-glutamyl-gamma-aminobutyrate hydrolase family protein [Albidovulum sp.]|nr:gamma-glutamyl-gamma-aminobutyrate hydrolase family protein [Albidovulum sp.]
MERPVVGIIGNSYLIDNQYPVHATGSMNSAAVSAVADAIPIMIPADPELFALDELLSTCDGFLFTGGRPNVHPEEYGEQATEAHGTFDRNRDRVALGLIRKCADRGQPILGLCRGFQEFNVALGGTLHPEIRELPGRMNHRMPPNGSLEEKFALRHTISLNPGGVFSRVFDANEIMVNSLHGQGIKKAGDRIGVDGFAPDGTEEAIFVEDAPGFALAVQWHPEYNASEDPVSRKLFQSFGKALRAWNNRTKSCSVGRVESLRAIRKSA